MSYLDTPIFFVCAKCGCLVLSGDSVHVVRNDPVSVEIFCPDCAPAHFSQPSITEQIETLLGLSKDPNVFYAGAHDPDLDLEDLSHMIGTSFGLPGTAILGTFTNKDQAAFHEDEE